MLGKLMKYEWKATWKLLVPLNLFIVVMSILAYITVQLDFFDSYNDLVLMTGAVLLLAYVLSMFVILVVTVIYLIYRFYTSVYGDEGYLLHTLPVDKHHIIIAKAVVGASWIILNVILIYLSILFLISTQGRFVETITSGFRFYAEMMNSYDKTGAFEVIMTLAASFFAMLARILKVTACVSLGQLASNHKVLSSIGFYYAIYIVQRIFTLFYYMIAELINRASDYVYYNPSIWGSSWEFTLLSSLVYCVVFYFLTWYVMDRKLNLD
ncbi:MAG: hypothetical protein NC341_08585 [Blautia sp.]|nr:hypothetical protein [Blautia sp.]MCM1201502.1 hypothetical protein [Bacteroides fragilis]